MIDSNPIRVAQIIGKMQAGGVEAVVFNYYRALDHSKVQFDFFYDSDSNVEPPQDLIDMGARFYVLPPYQKVGQYCKQLREYLKQNKYTIVHSHLNTLSVISLYTAWTAKVPVRIAHNHSVPGGHEWKRNILKSVLKLFSKVFATDYFACSEKAGRWLFGNRTYNKGKVTVVKNAFDFTKFDIPEDTVSELRDSLGIQPEQVIYGHVGRFTFAKNHRKLLELFSELHKTEPDARLLLVGDGELHDEIMGYISECGIQDSVILAGVVMNPEVYYSVIDVVILPSFYEGFSMTTIESQAAGVPIVVSEAVPDEAVISNGCFSLQLSDSNEQWIDTIREAKGKQVILNDRKQEFDIGVCAESLLEFYEKRDQDVRIQA